MKKKKSIFFIFFAFLLGSCVSTQSSVELHPFPTDKELYPAVYGAINEMYPGSKFTDIDFYNNTYKLANTIIYDGLSKNRLDVVIKLLSSGYVDVSFENRYMQDSRTGRWTPTDNTFFLLFNWRNFALGISNKIVEIANSPIEYEKHEKEAMADIFFIYAIMKNFTGLAFNEFIQNHAKGSLFVLEGLVSDVKEVNKEIDGIKYKYLVTISQKFVEDETYLSTSFNNYIYCTFYTNRDDVIRLNRTTVYKISAILVSASQGLTRNSVILELVESD